MREQARIYTVPAVADVVEQSIGAATIIPARGVWHGESELSAVIEIVGDRAETQLAVDVALGVARELGEQEIMVTRTLLEHATVIPCRPTRREDRLLDLIDVAETRDAFARLARREHNNDN